MTFAFTQTQYDDIQTWLDNGPDSITHFSEAYTSIAGWMEGYPTKKGTDLFFNAHHRQPD